ncbi:MAG: (d)CMP kinase [Candidatus Babeliales bacterium]|jgi:cytidylate kinase
MIITIDGPAASGKSSVARSLAQKLDYYYLYTGLLYRALAYMWVHVDHKLSLPVMPQDVATLTEQDLEGVHQLSYSYLHGEPHVYHQSVDITAHLSDTKLDQPASAISTSPLVRKALLSLQRSIAQSNDTIADGRDCGSVVFPHADIKFYLTADVDARARRLMADQTRRHHGATLERVKKEIVERDNRDRTRTESPLVIPKGAVIIDNTALTFEQTVATFMQEIQRVISC